MKKLLLGLATVATLCGVGTVFAGGGKPSVAVIEFNNETSAGWWSGGVGWELAGMVSNELAATGSFKVLERELEGKLDVDDLLKIVLASAADLKARLTELEPTLAQLKAQFSRMGHAKPDGLYLNYPRLQAEARVVEGEVTRRQVM